MASFVVAAAAWASPECFAAAFAFSHAVAAPRKAMTADTSATVSVESMHNKVAPLRYHGSNANRRTVATHTRSRSRLRRRTG